MKLSDFDFDLPKSLIAQYPSSSRTDSRLLVLRDIIVDSTFSQLGNFLKPNDLLVLNDTKVIAARLFGNKDSGGKVEVLVERLINDHEALVMIKSSRSPKIGSYVILENKSRFKICDKTDGIYKVDFELNSILNVLNEIGHIPLPPYINREDSKEDQSRYQTVYAKNNGAVAAPTAGLHFDEMLLSNLENQGISHTFVTLHVGAGTFIPIRTEMIEDHIMHGETYEISDEASRTLNAALRDNREITAVGTTVVRTLEAAYRTGSGRITPGKSSTDLYIVPGYRFNIIDHLITNFHTPRSSLLLLVSAFAGRRLTRKAYREAVARGYRFFSYGDAMIIL